MQEAELVSRGREAFAQRAWADAFESLSRADQAAPLGAEELELLATSAYMLGRDDEHIRALERAHHAHLNAGDTPRAVHCAYWIGHNLMLRGEMGPATGWFGRGQRLLEREERDCAERGYLLIPVLVGHAIAGDHGAAYETATEIAEIGTHFADRDLIAIGVHEQGHALVRQGRFEEGLRLLDEVMVGVTAGELSPIVTGIVYCNTIGFWQSVYELRRAREWTEALTRWCEQQPDMVAHTGVCLVHRAEIMQLQGAWDAALEEARRAGERFAEGVLNERVSGKASYRQGEVHRLRGERSAAEESYREASRRGYEPQPGLALLRLAEGKGDAASSAIRRVLDEASQPRVRAALLPAYVEIMLAGGEVEEARGACGELETIAGAHRSDMLRAMSAQARGALALAEGDPQRLLSRSVRRGRHGRSSKRPTRPHASASSWRSVAGQRATRTLPRGSWKPPALCSTGLGRVRTSSGSPRSRRVPRRPPLMGSRSGSCRCCASSPGARPTGPSPPSSCSASGRSTGT